ncbi:MAG: 23S rRNA (pseudouridine(1915)-N(3))-methyltransferase RlmH [Rhizobiaceae bacterium]
MRLAIFATGRMKSGPESELLQRYLDRSRKSGRQLGIQAVEIREFAESRKALPLERMGEEAATMLAARPAGSRLVILDERGQDLNSAAFSGYLRKCLETGIPDLVFMIGGPDGHGRAAIEAADLSIRLGSLTWPHQIARILLAEQIYRATTILSGHPYHRE